MDDRELNRLLREWTAPDAPPHLRPRRAQGSWLRWLVAGTIRVPVPVALAALLLAALWIASPRLGPTSTPQTSGPRPSGELARYALTGPLEGFDAVLVELNFAARRVSPGASSSRPHPWVRRGWADADRHQSPAGPDRAGGRHVLRTARRPSHVVQLPRTRMRPCAPWHSWWFPAAVR